MSRALVVPFTAICSYLIIDQPFYRQKVMPMTVAVIGVVLGAFADTSSNQAEKGENAGLGVALLVLSAAVQATQHVLEERLYRKDPKLEPLDLYFIESLWKNALVWLLMPLFAMIPVSTEICSSGVLESNRDAISEVR